MAADQKNFQNFLYVDDAGTHWTKRGETDAARAAVDGSAAQDGSQVWIDSARRKARYVILQDPTTFRTKRMIIYTGAAFAALADGATVAFHVEGEAATVDYTVIRHVAEKRPAAGNARQLADHA